MTERVSDRDLNNIISYYKVVRHEVGILTLKLLIELKQRREADSKPYPLYQELIDCGCKVYKP